MKQKKWNITIVDNPNIATISENDEFYTTDTEAFLVFELKDKNFNPTSATITLHNRTDGSVVNEDVDVIDGTIAYEMREEVIEHAGTWQAQLVYEQDKGGVPEKYTSKVVGFDVAGHLLDTKEPALVVIENWDNFVLTAEGTMERWKALEYIRQENENQRVAAETARQEAYDDLIDTGVMQENINQKLAASEAEYAPRLTELEQNDADLTTQLAQKANEIDVRESTDALPIDVDEMNTRTKQLFTGGSVAVVGENAVGRENIKRKAVSPSETDFIDVETGVNLFNKNAYGILQGKYIQSSGNFSDNEDYLISDFIEVKPNTEYRVFGTPGTPNFSNFYDGGKQLITVGPKNTNTPHNARFVRIHMLKTQVDNTILYEYKGVTQPFVPYKEDYKLKDDIKIRFAGLEPIPNDSITPDMLLQKELDSTYEELELPLGRHYLSNEGLIAEFGIEVLRGTSVRTMSSGVNVDAISFREDNFPNRANWPNTAEGNTLILDRFNLGEANTNTWDNIENIGKHGKAGTGVFWIYVEKGRFSDINDARQYFDNSPLAVYYLLETPQTIPYPENLSYNTKEIINLKLSGHNLPLGYDGEEWSEA